MLIFLKLSKYLLGETSLTFVAIIRVKMYNISKIDKKFPISSNSVNKVGKIVRNDSHKKREMSKINLIVNKQLKIVNKDVEKLRIVP